MNIAKYIGLFTVLLGIAAIGYMWISALALETRVSSEDVGSSQSLQRRGIVDAIDQDAKFLILKSPTFFKGNSVSRYKIYITDQTRVDQSSILSKDNVIYYEDVPTQGTLSNINVGDEILVIISSVNHTLVADYVRYGSPIPGI